MVKIYGASDDLVEIEGSNYAEDEIGCFEKDVLITFVDGTVIRIGYPRNRYGTWWIIVEEYGSNPVFHPWLYSRWKCQVSADYLLGLSDERANNMEKLKAELLDKIKKLWEENNE